MLSISGIKSSDGLPVSGLITPVPEPGASVPKSNRLTPVFARVTKIAGVYVVAKLNECAPEFFLQIGISSLN